MSPAGVEILNTVVLGGGPGGIALLLAARRGAGIAALMAGGFAMVERGPAIGVGTIGGHVITSDSSAETFLDCLAGDTHPALVALRAQPEALAVARYGAGAAPLSLVGDLVARIGATLSGIVAGHGGTILTGQVALGVRREAGGLWAVTLQDRPQGARRVLRCRHVVLSLGAEQPLERLRHEPVAGAPLLPQYAAKLLQSGEIFSHAGGAELRARLRGVARPRVVVVGGSTSAAAAANLLLTRLPEVTFQPGGVVLMHRRPLRIFYGSAAEALADGYTEFGPHDICPLTKRVYRLAGFRLDSRELVLQARGIGGRRPDPRLRLHRLDHAADDETRGLLEQADVIVAALGYRPRTVAVQDEDGAPIALRGGGVDMLPLVDDLCRVVDPAGQPIAGLFGLGLANGFVPTGRLGGESSFVGQANGLWLWQNDMGALIVKQVRLVGADGQLRSARADGQLQSPCGDAEGGVAATSRAA